MTLEELVEEALTKDGDVLTLTVLREGAEDFRISLGLPDGTTEGFRGVSVVDAFDTLLDEAGSEPDDPEEDS
jgi:hypothetical protein